MKRAFVASLILLWALTCLSAVYASDTGYSARVDELFSWADTVRTDNFLIAAAKIYHGKSADEGIQMFERMLQRRDNSPSGMFAIYSMMIGYLAARDKMPQSLRDDVRDYLAVANFYRGDTENHLTMYYTGLYLAAQTFPDLPARKWYTGKSSAENKQEAMDWFDLWMRQTTSIGQGEFDSPTYMPVFIAPMFGLSQFAEDPVLKQNALIMVHWLIADFAVEHLNGVYVGAHSRDYPERKIQPKHPSSDMTAWGWLLFGKTNSRYHPTLLAAALSDFNLPEILYSIGTDRDTPYVHTETKRVRNIIRFSEQRNPPVYKYTYMTGEYGLGSMMGGGILQPIQQHTWDVTFMTDSPYMCIFTVHPYIGEKDLGMFFPEEMKFAFDEVARHHTYYADEGKWASSSPYEKTFQHKNTLIVLYNIPPHERYGHIDGFFPKDLARRDSDASGWIFCRGGNTFIAYFPLQPYEWIEEADAFRLRSHDLKNGCIVEVAQADEYDSFDAFKAQIRTNTLVHDTFDQTLTVSYTTSAGDIMTFAYDGERRLNGHFIDYSTYKLFEGPFLNAEPGSRTMEITYKDEGMVLDMATEEKGQILPMYLCPKIDEDFALTGKIDNPAWNKSSAVPLVDAITGKDGKFATTVQALYSDAYLYVAFTCADDYIWGTETERNSPIYDEECVEVFLNPANAGHQYYEINLSPKNVVFDAALLNNRTPANPFAEFMGFPDWDMKKLETAVSIDGEVDSDGNGRSWTAELKIPMAELFGAPHCPPLPGDVWRANFFRIDSPKKGERHHYAWSPTERIAFHLPWRFGYLKFQ
ncbi:MAG: carbohydrate-binding family 9-like protein [Candidatus Zhuqueibacterota bacterium]